MWLALIWQEFCQAFITSVCPFLQVTRGSLVGIEAYNGKKGKWLMICQLRRRIRAEYGWSMKRTKQPNEQITWQDLRLSDASNPITLLALQPGQTGNGSLRMGHTQKEFKYSNCIYSAPHILISTHTHTDITCSFSQNIHSSYLFHLAFVGPFLPLLDRPLVYLLQILLECHLPLYPLRSLLLVAEYHLYLLFQSILLVNLLRLRFLLHPHIQKLQSVLYCDCVLVRAAVHQELGQVEYLLGLDPGIVEHALLVHLGELTLAYFLVELLVNLPDHQSYLLLTHLVSHFHLVQDTLNVASSKVLSIMIRRQYFEDVVQVLLLSGVQLELLQLLFDSLLLLGFPLLQLLQVELELFLRVLIFLKECTVLVLGSEVGGKVFEGIGLGLFLFCHWNNILLLAAAASYRNHPAIIQKIRISQAPKSPDEREAAAGVSSHQPQRR